MAKSEMTERVYRNMVDAMVTRKLLSEIGEYSTRVCERNFKKENK